MKKIIVALLFALAPAAAFSQAQIMPHIGLNLFQLSGDPDGVTHTTGAGYTIGANLRLGGLFFLQPGIEYLGERSIRYYKDPNGGINVNSVSHTTDFNTIRIPVVAGIQLLGESAPINANVHAGLSTRLTVGAKEEGADVTDYYNTFNLAGVIGAGAEVFFLTFDIDFELGLTDYAKQNNLPVGVNSDSKSFSILFNIGSKFPL